MTDSIFIDTAIWDYSQAQGYDAARQLPEWTFGDLVTNILIVGGRVSAID
jgi:hypothetical protein